MDIGGLKTAQHKGTVIQGLNSVKYRPVNESSKGFSRHLLGSLNGTSTQGTLIDNEVATDLSAISRLLGAEDLEGMDLSDGQLMALEQIGELDLEMIADILEIDLSEINKLHSDLQDLISSLSEEEIDEEISMETLASVLHLVQLSFSNESKQSKSLHGLDQLVKLSKVIELLANQKELSIPEAQKAMEVKDLLKHLQQKMDVAMSGFTSRTKTWNEVMQAAYNRHLPTEISREGVVTEQNRNGQAVSGNNIHISLPRTEQFTMTLSQANGQMRYEQFVKELQTILSRSQMQTQPNMSKLLIKLYPEQLGSLRIELLQQNGIMTAKILATTATAKELLDSQLQGLKQAFTSQNLQVEKIEISQALTDPERQSKGQSQQQPNGQSKQSHQDTSKNDEEHDSASFKEYLVNSEV
ncbi:flagellar hook-length control protein FliK [Bacillus sp. Marseille-Q1617]|uniref:flagellar hook-length control protein FliK n=1 Tax=Bacillus sp. Marseille-Q1617 TaxID=2736887 RepID=UPI00158B1699|nr:flagellar hook-length control protein FliK [Bacillus sp. Marseille-Q1617]